MVNDRPDPIKNVEAPKSGDAHVHEGYDSLAHARVERGDNLHHLAAKDAGDGAPSLEKGIKDALTNAAALVARLEANGINADEHFASFVTGKPGTDEHTTQSAVVALAQGKFNIGDLMKQA
jgi:hypothetical protein